MNRFLFFLRYPESALRIAVSQLRIRNSHHKHSRAIDRMQRSLKYMETVMTKSSMQPLITVETRKSIASTKAELLKQKDYFDSRCKVLLSELESIRRQIEVLETRANPQLLVEEIANLTVAKAKIHRELSWYEEMLAKIARSV